MHCNELLMASLESLSAQEAEIVERFYPLFFTRHPEVCELFGEHGISEREEMIRETLASVVAHVEDEPWLDENLEAMGRSHEEYGVEGPMYEGYVACLLDTLEAVAGADWTPGHREAWGAALERLADTMRRAGSATRASQP
jgi:hemoglobin-like flavoprotein